MEFNFKKIEKKWQKRWEEEGVFKVKESKKKKFYSLEMYPYPSATGLHMGHAFNYTIGDVYARFKRMQGFNVLHPMGYDSFGLPAENAAIKAGKHPKPYTEQAIKNYIKQMKDLGLSYDWSKLVNSMEPEYYKWNQFFFLKFLENGLAYRKKSAVNWCFKCDTVLANEQVHNGTCWRHEDTGVEVKQLEQWFLKTTNYAQELLDCIDDLQWPEKIKTMQRNWIGKSEGTEVEFEINRGKIQINNVEHFRKNVNINSKLKIKNKEFHIQQIVKFRLDDGSFYMKLFLQGGYVLADDAGDNSFIFVKESKNNLEIKKDKINFKSKKFDFSYSAHAVAEETYGKEIFTKGESETFWDYISDKGSYLSLGIVDKTKKRLDFEGEIIYAKDIQILKDDKKWKVFTTRPDTLYGVTFMVVSAQHSELMDLVTEEQKKEVQTFLKRIRTTKQEDIDKLEKEGVFTGSYAINPINEEKIPVYAANFVIAEYGSGMVMGVPAHDKRDFDFAKKYDLPIKYVVSGGDENGPYLGNGKLINSDIFDNVENNESKWHITDYLEAQKLGKKTIQYKLRDWLISRQRYWGTPIPIVYCDECGIVPVPEKELPIKLPEKVKFGKGNPLETNEKFVNAKCPKCNGKAKRETDTMDTFVDSSWYYMRYPDNNNSKKPFDEKIENFWLPVDQYIGGIEHATMHLLYARFWTKALRDLGYVKYDEPFTRLFNQGMLHGEDGEKMSKSKGNVILPEVVSKKYGIDTARFFLMSLAAPDKPRDWSDQGVKGSLKFIKKVIDYFDTVKIGKSDSKIESKLNKTIKEVTNQIDNFKYNLAVIKIRDLFNSLNEEESKDVLEKSLKLLSPFCPHIAEELWEKIGGKGFVSLAEWPKSNEKKINEQFEKEEELFEKLISDINHVSGLIQEKENKKMKKVFVYVLPNEKENYGNNLEIIQKRTNLIVKIFSVSDKEKHDPENKSKKVKPGRPGIYLE